MQGSEGPPLLRPKKTNTTIHEQIKPKRWRPQDAPTENDGEPHSNYNKTNQIENKYKNTTNTQQNKLTESHDFISISKAPKENKQNVCTMAKKPIHAWRKIAFQNHKNNGISYKCMNIPVWAEMKDDPPPTQAEIEEYYYMRDTVRDHKKYDPASKRVKLWLTLGIQKLHKHLYSTARTRNTARRGSSNRKPPRIPIAAMTSTSSRKRKLKQTENEEPEHEGDQKIIDSSTNNADRDEDDDINMRVKTGEEQEKTNEIPGKATSTGPDQKRRKLNEKPTTNTPSTPKLASSPKHNDVFDDLTPTKKSNKNNNHNKNNKKERNKVFDDLVPKSISSSQNTNGTPSTNPFLSSSNIHKANGTFESNEFRLRLSINRTIQALDAKGLLTPKPIQNTTNTTDANPLRTNTTNNKAPPQGTKQPLGVSTKPNQENDPLQVPTIEEFELREKLKKYEAERESNKNQIQDLQKKLKEVKQQKKSQMEQLTQTINNQKETIKTKERLLASETKEQKAYRQEMLAAKNDRGKDQMRHETELKRLQSLADSNSSRREELKAEIERLKEALTSQESKFDAEREKQTAYEEEMKDKQELITTLQAQLESMHELNESRQQEIDSLKLQNSRLKRERNKEKELVNNYLKVSLPITPHTPNTNNEEKENQNNKALEEETAFKDYRTNTLKLLTSRKSKRITSLPPEQKYEFANDQCVLEYSKSAGMEIAGPLFKKLTNYEVPMINQCIKEAAKHPVEKLRYGDHWETFTMNATITGCSRNNIGVKTNIPVTQNAVAEDIVQYTGHIVGTQYDIGQVFVSLAEEEHKNDTTFMKTININQAAPAGYPVTIIAPNGTSLKLESDRESITVNPKMEESKIAISNNADFKLTITRTKFNGNIQKYVCVFIKASFNKQVEIHKNEVQVKNMINSNYIHIMQLLSGEFK